MLFYLCIKDILFTMPKKARKGKRKTDVLLLYQTDKYLQAHPNDQGKLALYRRNE